MVDPRNRFVFVHIPKTAGQSVVSCLRKQILSPRQRIVQRIGRHVGRKSKYDHYGLYRGGGHGRAWQIRDAIGKEVFDQSFSFAFVRNPWDRLYSQFKFEALRPGRRRFELAKSGDFEAYLDFLLTNPNDPQLNYIIDENGRKIVDFIGRFENLNSDFESICNRLGLTSELPHKNSSGGKSYLSQYTPTTKEMVRDLCAVDIKHFRYTFE